MLSWENLLRDPFTAQFLLIVVSLAVLIICHFVFNNRGPPQLEPMHTPRPAPALTAKQRSASLPLPLTSRPLGQSANRLFGSYPTVSMCCSVLFTETQDEALTEGISMLSDVTTVLREAANVSKVYLVFHDKSPDGLLGAILGSALEADGLLGHGPGQVPKHRVLTCSTEVGKVAIVRQLECSLHIENCKSVYDELARFKTKQWFVAQPNQPHDLVQIVNETS
jgi:hypothetical protein